MPLNNSWPNYRAADTSNPLNFGFFVLQLKMLQQWPAVVVNTISCETGMEFSGWDDKKNKTMKVQFTQKVATLVKE